MYHMLRWQKRITSFPFGPKFDTSKVTEMSFMFWEDSAITTLDLSTFDTSSVTGMFGTFRDCSKLKTIYVSDKWTTVNVTDKGETFVNSPKIVGGAGTKQSNSRASADYARIDGNGGIGYFTRK